VSAAARRVSGLYAVTPDNADTIWLVAAVEAALKGGARLIQYRNKAALPRLRREQACALRAVCARFDRPLIVNDDLDAALASGADGVHVGADDAPISAAREALGPGKLVGVSCYGSLERARAARDSGADYVAFGSFFPSRVKPHAVAAPVTLLGAARREIDLPLVAIGGITAENGERLVAAGADALAVISSVFGAADIEAAARGFNRLFR
jgi:thiamine-phosphate pyrophosphorylase